MSDVYANITIAPDDTIDQLIDILELRAADPRQQIMRAEYLQKIPLSAGARVLEVGCGTGAICRTLSHRAEGPEVWGIDPSPAFIQAAKVRANGTQKLFFCVGDGRKLDFANESFSAVIAHTVLSHVPEPEQAIAEAYRVLKPGGTLAIFDGDYASTTVANCQHDPLQACVHAAIEELVHDPYIVRRLHTLVSQGGFDPIEFATHGYLDCWADGYLATFAHRGAGFLAAQGRITESTASALRSEVRQRLESGRAFGHILYASLLATKPYSRCRV